MPITLCVRGTLRYKDPEPVLKGNTSIRTFGIELLTDNPKYPNQIGLELRNDRCVDIDPFQIGEELVVNVDLSGRTWTSPEGREVVFNRLSAWRIRRANEVPSTEAPGIGVFPLNEGPTAQPTQQPAAATSYAQQPAPAQHKTARQSIDDIAQRIIIAQPAPTNSTTKPETDNTEDLPF